MPKLPTFETYNLARAFKELPYDEMVAFAEHLRVSMALDDDRRRDIANVISEWCAKTIDAYPRAENENGPFPT